MEQLNHKKTKSLILFVVIVVLSFVVLLFAFELIPLSDFNNNPSFDIHKEIEGLNEDRTNKYTIVESDWLDFKQGIIGSDWQLFDSQDNWNDFKECLKSNPPTQNTLRLDENNRVIWYGILPTIYFEY